jgi:predicted oxidoreductase
MASSTARCRLPARIRRRIRPLRSSTAARHAFHRRLARDHAAAVAWHENDLAQLVGPRAWYGRGDNDRVTARAAGGTVVGREEGLAVHVAAAVTHTIGGLQVNSQARVVGADGLWAAGVDAGGVATGGYASGLAQALVLGLVAAESI